MKTKGFRNTSTLACLIVADIRRPLHWQRPCGFFPKTIILIRTSTTPTRTRGTGKRCAENHRREQLIKSSIQILSDPGNIAVPMSTEKAQAIARVHWTRGAIEISFLDVGSLPAPPHGQAIPTLGYCGWHSVDMGFLITIESGLCKKFLISNSQAFAVTLEPKEEGHSTLKKCMWWETCSAFKHFRLTSRFFTPVVVLLQNRKLNLYYYQ
jgi:hypothetical protein